MPSLSHSSRFMTGTHYMNKRGNYVT
jgi:hypothetical protein